MGDKRHYSWEPVILSSLRRPLAPTMTHLIANVERYKWRPLPENYVIGSKPPAFSRWLFRCAGLEPSDEFIDLFVGSGAVTDEWAKFCAQGRLVG